MFPFPLRRCDASSRQKLPTWESLKRTRRHHGRRASLRHDRITTHCHFLALAAFCAPAGTFAFPKPTLSFAFGLAFTGASGLIVVSVLGGAPNSAISIPNTSASFEASSTLAPRRRARASSAGNQPARMRNRVRTSISSRYRHRSLVLLCTANIAMRSASSLPSVPACALT